MSTITKRGIPLIRWAGSKREIISQLIEKAPTQFDRYVEPFAGSACLFFSIKPKKALLADLNSELIHTYHIIKSHPIRVLRAAKRLDSTSVEYYRIRSIKPQSLSPINRAARFLYLNRHCYNALYRTNRLGDFNVPIGSKRSNFPDEDIFRNSAALLERADVMCCDFESTLEHAKKGDFVYLDPPYVSRSRKNRNEYGVGSFSVNDIPRLVRSLKRIHKLGVQFLFSYAHCRDLLDIISVEVKTTISVRRRISGVISARGFAKEVLLTNSDLFE